MDMISKLPSTIIENILCLVPIQEAARTSILSKEWRYHWTKIPKFVFEEDTFQVSTYGDELSAVEESFDNNIQSQRKGMTKRCKLFYVIFQVLLQHDGPIHEFTLSMQTDKTCVEIDLIISHLVRKNTLKKLTLNTMGDYRLPLSIICFEHLTYLYLTMCDFDHQPPFNGFHSLTTLFMEHVFITKGTLLHLLSKCPSLKSLTLHTVGFEGICDSTIPNLFECIPLVENLTIFPISIEPFSQDGIPRVLPTALIHLKRLFIDTLNIEYEGLPVLLLLLRSSPNLEKLKLRIFYDVRYEEPEEHSSEDNSDVFLGRLNMFEIINLSNDKDELDIVKLILAKSPILKKMKIILCEDIDNDDELQILRFLLLFQHASPFVKFVVERNSEVYV